MKTHRPLTVSHGVGVRTPRRRLHRLMGLAFIASPICLHAAHAAETHTPSSAAVPSAPTPGGSTLQAPLSIGTGSSSSLSLYGLIDVGVATTHVSKKGSSTGLIEGGQADSFWGIRGSEDLGDGARANFQLESGFDPNTGRANDRDRLFNYGAWVGLSHARAGEIRLGRQRTIGQQFGNSLEIAGWKDFGLGATFRASDNFQYDNVINVYSPNLNGLTAAVGYSFGTHGQGSTTSRSMRALSTGLRYEEGPLNLVATYDRLRPDRSRHSLARDPDAFQLGGSYDFDVVKVSAGWSLQRHGLVSFNGADYSPCGDDTCTGIDGIGPQGFVGSGRLNAYYLGAAIPMGPGELMLQASLVKPKFAATAQAAPLTGQMYSVGYLMPLSKRTKLYTFAGHMRNLDVDQLLTHADHHTYRVAMGMTHEF